MTICYQKPYYIVPSPEKGMARLVSARVTHDVLVDALLQWDFSLEQVSYLSPWTRVDLTFDHFTEDRCGCGCRDFVPWTVSVYQRHGLGSLSRWVLSERHASVRRSEAEATFLEILAEFAA